MCTRAPCGSAGSTLGDTSSSRADGTDRMQSPYFFRGGRRRMKSCRATGDQLTKCGHTNNRFLTMTHTHTLSAPCAKCFEEEEETPHKSPEQETRRHEISLSLNPSVPRPNLSPDFLSRRAGGRGPRGGVRRRERRQLQREGAGPGQLARGLLQDDRLLQPGAPGAPGPPRGQREPLQPPEGRRE